MLENYFLLINNEKDSSTVLRSIMLKKEEKELLNTRIITNMENIIYQDTCVAQLSKLSTCL